MMNVTTEAVRVPISARMTRRSDGSYHTIMQQKAMKIEAISGNHYGGNRRNMSVEKEEELPERFRVEAAEGKLIDISD